MLTNGDMIKALFPNEEIIDADSACVYYGTKMRFDKDLWNAPYEEDTDIKQNGWVHISDIYRLIAGHSDYHGDNILSALTCLSEGKEVKAPITTIDKKSDSKEA